MSLRFPTFDVKRTTAWQGRDSHQVEMFYAPSYDADYSSAPSIVLKCRQFRPSKNEILTKSFPTPDGAHLVKLPPYTLTMLPKARQIMENFVTDNVDFFVEELKVGDVGMSFSSTFDEVKRLSKTVNI